jgi:hypothetical protein
MMVARMGLRRMRRSKYEVGSQKLEGGSRGEIAAKVALSVNHTGQTALVPNTGEHPSSACHNNLPASMLPLGRGTG